MNHNPLSKSPAKATAARRAWLGTTPLECVTAVVLLFVLAGVAWMFVVALRPDLFRLPTLEMEAMILVVLLAASTLLVSIVALCHNPASQERLRLEDGQAPVANTPGSQQVLL